MTKKYCLTILKDGIYQEVTDQELEEFIQLCPIVAEILKDNSLVGKIP
jgi:hypothetical protein